MAHDYRGLPIARAENLVKTDTGITAKVIFPDEGVYPLADTVYNLYKGKFMRAWSIGFIPIKSEDIVDDENKDSKVLRRGTRFKTWELLEFSGCSVPDNPTALTNMLSKGIDIELLKEEGFIEIVDEPKDKVVDKEAVTEPEETKEDDKVKDKEQFPEEKEEPSKGFDIDEIYEIVKENKELKEKIKAVELKAGAVLNAKNKSNLKNAQNLIQSVLDSAGTTEEDTGKVVDDDNKNDKGDDNVIDIVTDTVDDIVIDEEKNGSNYKSINGR